MNDYAKRFNQFIIAVNVPGEKTKKRLKFINFISNRWGQGVQILYSTLSRIVQFWTPSPVTQRRGERVQDHLSAHARAKPIVAHTTSTCLFRREIQKLAQKLFQHAAGKNVGERSYDAEKI